MGGVYLFAAVADDARPRSERMSNMAMLGRRDDMKVKADWSISGNLTGDFDNE